MQVGGREIIYLSLKFHHQNDPCIKMGSDESHFNVSVGNDGQSHKAVSTNHNLFEEKGEPKRYRTEVLPLTSITPYCYVRTVRRTVIRFLTELSVRRTWFQQFDELYFVLNWLVMRCKLRPDLAADA